MELPTFVEPQWSKRRTLLLVALLLTAGLVVAGGVWYMKVLSSENLDATQSATSITAATPREVTKTVTVGVRPTHVAVDPLSNSVYVTNQGDLPRGDNGSVSVIDTITNAVKGTIPVKNVRGVAVDPGNHRAYVTASGGVSVLKPQTDIYVHIAGSVVVLDTRTNEVMATIKVGINPEGMAVDPQSNTLYVANQGNNQGSLASAWNGSISVVDTQRNEVKATLETESTLPYDVAFDPETRKAYFATRSNSILVFDSSSNTIDETITAGDGPTHGGDVRAGALGNMAGIEVDPETHRIYLTGMSRVSLIDPSTKAVLAEVSAGSLGGLALDAQAGTLFVTNTKGGAATTGAGSVPVDGVVYLVNTVTNNVAAAVNAGNHPSGVAVDPRTHVAYVANPDDGTVSVISPV